MPKLLENLEIIHPHGAFGPCSWDDFGTVTLPEKRPSVTEDQIRTASTYIKIIHENPGSGQEYGRIWDALAASGRVIVLGFGRLLRGRWLSARHSIHGTAFGLAAVHRREAERSFERRIVLTEEDCYTFLVNYRDGIY